MLMHIQKRIAQVPGQVYPVQVLQENGNGLYAGFFLLDAEGNPITEEYFTDQDGLAHITMPDYNADKIFVEFYSTPDYKLLVKPIADVLHDGTVTLIKKEKGLSTEATLSIIGIGLAVMALPKQSKGVGGLKQIPQQTVQWVSRRPIGEKLLMIGAAGFGIWYLLKYKPKKEQIDYLDEAKKMLETLATDYGIYPSLTAGQYRSLVSVIYKAIDKCGTDEEGIYRSFETLNNEADIYKLIIEWGIQKYDGCFEWNGTFGKVHFTLSEAVTADMNDSEVRQVNDILDKKGISFSF